MIKTCWLIVFFWGGRKMRKDHFFGSEELKSWSNHYTGGGTSIPMMLEWWVIDFFKNQRPGALYKRKKIIATKLGEEKVLNFENCFCLFLGFFVYLFMFRALEVILQPFQVVNQLFPFKITSAWFIDDSEPQAGPLFLRKRGRHQNVVSAAGRPLFPGENGVDQLVEIVKVKGGRKDSDSGGRFLGRYLMMAGLYLLWRKIHISYIIYIHLWIHMLHIHILYMFHLLHKCHWCFLQGITFRISKFSGSRLVQGGTRE